MKIAILGDGQLAKMLNESKANLIGVGLDISILKKDSTKLSGFDVVIFENEFVDCDALESLSDKLTFVPNLYVIRALQDKLSQKNFLLMNSIPTARFEMINESNAKTSESLFKKLIFLGFSSGVLKWARFGYDGKGVKIYRNLEKLSPAEKSEIFEFVKVGFKNGNVYVEELVNYIQELAMVSVRSASGEYAQYPLVISRQTNGICDQVLGPATKFNVPDELEVRAAYLMRQFGDAMKIVGAYAFEFFMTGSGLIVNEVAPRVHNTGHYSIEATECSQFENHLRASVGISLGEPTARSCFIMKNLLGPRKTSNTASTKNFALEKFALEKFQDFCNEQDVHLHWYGKDEIRPDRKCGHVTICFDDPRNLEKVMSSIDQIQKFWES